MACKETNTYTGVGYYQVCIFATYGQLIVALVRELRDWAVAVCESLGFCHGYAAFVIERSSTWDMKNEREREREKSAQ